MGASSSCYLGVERNETGHISIHLLRFIVLLSSGWCSMRYRMGLGAGCVGRISAAFLLTLHLNGR